MVKAVFLCARRLYSNAYGVWKNELRKVFKRALFFFFALSMISRLQVSGSKFSSSRASGSGRMNSVAGSVMHL